MKSGYSMFFIGLAFMCYILSINLAAAQTTSRDAVELFKAEVIYIVVSCYVNCRCVLLTCLQICYIFIALHCA